MSQYTAYEEIERYFSESVLTVERILSNFISLMMQSVDTLSEMLDELEVLYLERIALIEKQKGIIYKIADKNASLTLNRVEKAFMDAPFPIILLANECPQIYLADGGAKEYRASSPLTLGGEIKIIATDTFSNATKLSYWLRAQGLAVKVALFDDLRRATDERWTEEAFEMYISEREFNNVKSISDVLEETKASYINHDEKKALLEILKVIEQKRQSLGQHGHIKAAEAAQVLRKSISEAIENYTLGQSNIQALEDAIDMAVGVAKRSDLKNHRGCTQILLTLVGWLSSILTLGSANCISKCRTGQWSFWHSRTDSIKRVDQVSKAYHSLLEDMMCKPKFQAFAPAKSSSSSFIPETSPRATDGRHLRPLDNEDLGIFAPGAMAGAGGGY